MVDLQSTALAAWLRRLTYYRKTTTDFLYEPARVPRTPDLTPVPRLLGVHSTCSGKVVWHDYISYKVGGKAPKTLPRFSALSARNQALGKEDPRETPLLRPVERSPKGPATVPRSERRPLCRPHAADARWSGQYQRRQQYRQVEQRHPPQRTGVCIGRSAEEHCGNGHVGQSQREGNRDIRPADH
jgi:hypothetical protein